LLDDVLTVIACLDLYARAALQELAVTGLALELTLIDNHLPRDKTVSTTPLIVLPS